MVLALFLGMFILNLAVSRSLLRTYFSPLGVFGSAWLGGLTLSQIGLVRYNQMSLAAIVIYIIHYGAFLFGSLLVLLCQGGVNRTRISGTDMQESVDNRLVLFALRLMVAISLLSTLYIWHILISNYGSLSYILQNAFTIRLQLINNPNSPIPVWASYLASLANAAAALGGYYVFFVSRKEWTAYLPIGVSFLCDLTTFGRVGTIWTLLLYGSAFVASGKMQFRRPDFRRIGKAICLVVLVLLLLSLPRLIRGNFDGFSATVRGYEGALAVNTRDNPFINGLVTFYVYGTGSFTAFSEYIKAHRFAEPTFGKALFTPVFRVLRRLGYSSRFEFSNLYLPVRIPFDFNVFTYLRDVYSDLGPGGFLVVPIFLGFLSTMVMFALRKAFSLPLLVIQLYLYMFFVFSVIYNPFSFGINIIGLGAALTVAVLCSRKVRKGAH